MQRREVFRLAVLGLFPSGKRLRTKSTSDRVLPGVPNPKFKFGDRVLWEWENDDEISPELGRVYRDEGVVMGMVWNPDNWYLDGWVYWVKWDNVESDPRNAIGLVCEMHESDLELVAIPFHWR
jgi:hypothetical protein